MFSDFVFNALPTVKIVYVMESQSQIFFFEMRLTLLFIVELITKRLTYNFALPELDPILALTKFHVFLVFIRYCMHTATIASPCHYP